jgi:pimeloyl-ACP methyl ester carboxylesterase
MVDLQVFALSGGRDFAWSDLGSTEGAPVVALHGSPGTGHDFDPVAGIAASCDVRLIAVDRPGYGHSTFDPKRTYESSASDIAELAEHLGLGRFGVVGWSSGGPNAAACARFLGDHLTGCAIVSGPAPPQANVSKRAKPRVFRTGERLGVRAPRLVGMLAGAGLRQGQRDPDRALAWMLRTLPPCDAAVIGRPEIRAAVRAGVARPPSATAGRAAVQDVVLESRSWGFALTDIDVPVHVWHGDADRNVAVGNGVYQARQIPGARLHQMPSEGHWLLVDHFRDILEPLRDRP